VDPLRLRVASFNIRHDADRYAERKPVLVREFAALDADFVGLQEVVFGEEQQHFFLAQSRTDRPYSAHDARSDRDTEFGNAILSRTGTVLAHEELRLSHGRVAHRILVLLPGNRTLWFANTHLHHRAAEPEVRAEQATAYAAWLIDAPEADALVAAGDFNAHPDERAYHVMVDAGFRSLHAEATGHEPRLTRPPGARPEPRGEAPACVDYVWFRGSAIARDAGLGAARPANWDPSLFASDHLAVVGELELA